MQALVIQGGCNYLTKWEGYDDMTWETAANLSKAKQMHDDNEKQH